MKQALTAARKVAEENEVPVGATLVRGDTLLAAAGNRPVQSHDPTAHAEILVIRHAAILLSNYRLIDTTLYVTLEPCIMCVGAMIHARIKRLVYGATDPKTGAIQSLYSLTSDDRLNHRIEVTGGILEPECSQLLKSFFKARRKK